MSIFLGRSGFRRRLREFNPCHDPKTGMFAPKGQGECGPGNWDDAGRQRAIYGNFIDDPDLTSLDKTEADELREEVDRVTETSQEQKDTISRKLAEKLEERLSDEQIDALHDSLGFHGLNTHLDGISQSDADVENNGPDPDDVKESYDEYREGAEQEAWDSHYSVVQDEYERYRDKVIENVSEYAASVLEAAEAIQRERQETGSDPEMQGTLPEFDPRTNQTLDLSELVGRALASHGSLDAFKTIDEDDVFEIDDVEIELVREYLAKHSPYATINNDLSDEDEVAGMLEDVGHRYIGKDKYGDGFDYYRDERGGEPDFDDVKSFDDWYEHEYGVSPDNWQGESESSGIDAHSESNAYQVASFLLHTWAETSGDSNVVSVGLQQAAEQAFDLGPTYAGLFVRDKYGSHGGSESFIEKTKSFYADHKEALTGFLQVMHEHTQEFLDKRYDGDYVTLYRGMKFAGSDDPGWTSVNDLVGRGGGAMVDVLLQPISSFSTDYSTAGGFSGGIGNGGVFAVRVPKKRILSTTATGFGAMGEHEVTVLGGRYPAFTTGAYREGGESGFWRIYNIYRRRQPVATDPFPGEAW